MYQLIDVMDFPDFGPESRSREMKIPTRLVVGIGNVGKQFTLTRHNVGFEVVEHFAKRCRESEWRETNAGRVRTSTFRFDTNGLDLVDLSSKRRRETTLKEGVPYPSVRCKMLLPSTYVNRSGSAVLQTIQQERLKLRTNAMSTNGMDEMIVVTDDVNVPFGQIRMRPSGGHGGHNGLRDITSRLGTNKYVRLRVGVGEANSGVALDKHVLGKFSSSEMKTLPSVLDFCADVLLVYLHRGYNAAGTIANSWDLDTYRRVTV